ncbi:MAG: bifunctional diaminohydroxyphosphoribosylaminopyrimidine deaminase/5-amino-6-(5-phosphoribosylamino)uracil reductase RibD [Bacteroidetes bacterium]|nr:bifunctional diaminohydroxyphosphoribosylaminopyrimidine deaminase/5-amino-6-(5-phosphoribosylamino)uracil reductase RibD [Bacteroidota bacterium]HET6244277.1 bifunctional diaminohydroxyphosphoribosylaminopyrimidine deaminase/5-amino-6-(5-phosphoribosylamino)uracil reductase RibD [Bacteroidia bacterium]
MVQSQHEIYMQRCIELAKNGTGKVAPNPLVGCVIVFEGKIIGEGFHRKFGEAHAEVNAINSVEDKSILKKSIVYINLEPCAHYGKTPPCADLLIHYNIPEVVIGCIDTFSAVSGKGIEKLRNSGCKVSVGVLEKKARELNKRFFTFHEKKRPYIILKWAQTIDGFIDKTRITGNPGQNKISSDFSQVMVHKWRSEEQAIMVGTNTANNDNPKLNVRIWKGSNPLRIVIDKSLRLPLNNHLFDQSVSTLVFTAERTESKNNLEYFILNFIDVPKEVCFELHQRGIQSLLVEGGAVLLKTFINSGLWDEARVFYSPLNFQKGIKAPELINMKICSKDVIQTDDLYCFRNINSQ